MSQGVDPSFPSGVAGLLPQQTPHNSTSLILEASHIACAGACRLYGFQGYNAKASAQFILVFDSQTLPSDGATAVLVLTVATVANFSAYFGSSGRWFDRGLVLCNSSTEPTKTLGAADCFFDVQYL